MKINKVSTTLFMGLHVFIAFLFLNYANIGNFLLGFVQGLIVVVVLDICVKLYFLYARKKDKMFMQKSFDDLKKNIIDGSGLSSNNKFMPTSSITIPFLCVVAYMYFTVFVYPFAISYVVFAFAKIVHDIVSEKFEKVILNEELDNKND